MYSKHAILSIIDDQSSASPTSDRNSRHSTKVRVGVLVTLLWLCLLSTAAGLPPATAQTSCVPSSNVGSGEGGGSGGNAGVPVCPEDFGDAPDTYGVLRASGGAWHTQNPLLPLKLGLTVDTEQDGQPTPLAWGDLDPDEDGLVTSSLHQGWAGSTISVRPSGGAGRLQGWVDFNANGSWQVTEWPIFDVAIPGAGLHVIQVPVPAAAVVGITYMRLRFSTVAGLFSGGGAPDGEVEDYAIRICPPIGDECCRKVVYLLDTSGSMSRGARTANSISALVQMINAMTMPPSSAAIVTFDANAVVQAPMQTNKAALMAIASGLTDPPIARAGATSHVAAINTGQAQFGQPDENCPNVMVLVTDGRDSDPPGAARAAATAAKNAGTRLVVISIEASPADTTGLQALASPGDYYPAATAEELPLVIAQALPTIACEVSPCPPPGAPTESLPDVGDAPDSSNHFQVSMTAYNQTAPAVIAHFPTVADVALGQPVGPKHLLPSSDVWLGEDVSKEFDADFMPDQDLVANLRPIHDDSDNDDLDDGLGLPWSMPSCGSSTLGYTLTVASNMQPRFVNAWIDFNRDGDWNDVSSCTGAGGLVTVNEWIVQNHPVQLTPGVHGLVTPVFNAMEAPSAGQTRFWLRLTVAENLAPNPGDGRGPLTGYQYGETEDYLLELRAGAGYEQYPED